MSLFGAGLGLAQTWGTWKMMNRYEQIGMKDWELGVEDAEMGVIFSS